MKENDSRTSWKIRSLERLIRLFLLLLSGLKFLLVFDGSTERAHRGSQTNILPGFVSGPLDGGFGLKWRGRERREGNGKGVG